MYQLGIFLKFRFSYISNLLNEGWPLAGLSPPAMQLTADGIPKTAMPVRVRFLSQLPKGWGWGCDTYGQTLTAIGRDTTAPLIETWHHTHSHWCCFPWQPPNLLTLQRSRSAFRTVLGHYNFPFLLCTRGSPHHSKGTPFGRNLVPTDSSFRGQWITLLVSLVPGTFYSRVAFTHIS